MKTTLVLFIIGILLSTTLLSQSDSTVVLTEKNTVHFNGPVNDVSVANAQVQLSKVSKGLNSGDVIYLVIDSPGGSVSAGNTFIDFANAIPQKIKPICVFCASMGYHMFQSFDERLVMPSSTLMSHRASLGGLSGQVPGELESRLNWIKDTLQRMDVSVAKRVGTSVSDYQKLIYDELWLNGNKAVQIKHADRITKIKCSPELAAGTHQSTVNTLFGPVEVTTSKCPLINGILGFKFQREAFRSETEALLMVRKYKRSAVWSF